MESDEKRLGSVSNVLVEKEDLVHGDLQVGGSCDCACCIRVECGRRIDCPKCAA